MFFKNSGCIILLIAILCSCTPIETTKINENGRNVHVMKPERIITKKNMIMQNTSIGLHFEYDQFGLLQGFVLVTAPSTSYFNCHPGDQIMFDVQNGSSTERLTYTFSNMEMKRRISYIDAEAGLGVLSPLAFTSFNISLSDLMKISKSNKTTVSVFSHKHGKLEDQLPESALKTIQDFVKKI